MSNEVMDRDAILARAIAIAAPAEREAFIAQACGHDTALRDDVARVVAEHFDARGALNGSADSASRPAASTGHNGAQSAAGKAAAAAAIGTYIGPYKVLQPIGEGGRGVVFLADQEHPVRRKVALKVFNPDTDAQPVLARYETEQRALSLLDHPNIAKVFNVSTVPGPSSGAAGHTAPFAGRCYVAMEPVKGVPITQYCDEKRLPLAKRLELFVAVCQAVQHAHHKGVLHGNIKPSNVLVTGTDEHPIARVTEIGVAGQADKSLEYMSPEQTQPDATDVDSRSDVYSLGVLLYELLTGTTPLSPSRLREVGRGEACRLIREGQPLPPSQYLSESTDRVAVVAGQRQTDPESLIGAVRGELDSVVMQALQKDRNRRYDTAAALGRDVQRYLTDHPVEAHPATPGYELRKLGRRNRRGALFTGAILAALLAAGGIGAILGLWAMRARDAAEVVAQEAEAQRDEALAVNKVLKDQLAQSEATAKGTKSALEQALSEETTEKRTADDERAVLNFFQNRVLTAGRPIEFFAGGAAYDKNVTLRRALNTAEPHLANAFPGKPLAQALAREIFGSAYLDLGDAAQAVKEYQQALALRQKAQGPESPDTIACRNNLAHALRVAGRTEAASELYDQLPEPQARKRP